MYDSNPKRERLSTKDKLLVAGFSVFCLIALLFAFINFTSTTPEKSAYEITDPVSGITYSTLAGKYMPDNDLSIIGLELLSRTGIQPQVLSEAITTFISYINYTNIQCNKISIYKDKVSYEDKTLRFSVKPNSGPDYNIEIKNLDDKNFQMKIGTNKGELLSYDSSRFKTLAKDPVSLFKNHLPHSGQTASGKSYGFTMNGNGDYEITVNSCGDQTIKDEALESVKSWLKSINYDPDELNIVIPEYCPRG